MNIFYPYLIEHHAMMIQCIAVDSMMVEELILTAADCLWWQLWPELVSEIFNDEYYWRLIIDNHHAVMIQCIAVDSMMVEELILTAADCLWWQLWPELVSEIFNDEYYWRLIIDNHHAVMIQCIAVDSMMGEELLLTMY